MSEATKQSTPQEETPVEQTTAPEQEAQAVEVEVVDEAADAAASTLEEADDGAVPTVEVLKAKLAAAEQTANVAKDQLLRTAAEYENYRKRSAREADQKFNDGIGYAINQIIPILDTLEMAEKAPCADESYKKGVTMTLDKASKAFETLHIVEIEAQDKPFDPNTMNAVSQVPAPEGVESGAVVTVYQKGYKVGDKIIRHATVVVAE